MGCPENCNDPKILEAVYDKTPTENKGKKACNLSLLSDKKGKNMLYVHTLCKTECKPYYKGTVIKMCKDKKVLEAVYNPDKIPTKINTIKPLIDRVEVTRGKICGLIKETNGEEACKSPLLSNKQNKNVIYVHTLCKTECKPYYKGKLIEIKKEECTYPEIKDPIFEIIIKFPDDYKSVCALIEKELLIDKKQLCAIDLFADKNTPRFETPKCLLCPDICNDKKVLEAEYVPDKTPTKNSAMKALIDRVEVTRGKICGLISATNGEEACKSPLLSNKKNKNVIY